MASQTRSTQQELEDQIMATFRVALPCSKAAAYIDDFGLLTYRHRGTDTCVIDLITASLHMGIESADRAKWIADNHHTYGEAIGVVLADSCYKTFISVDAFKKMCKDSTCPHAHAVSGYQHSMCYEMEF